MLATAELRKKHMELNILWDWREYMNWIENQISKTFCSVLNILKSEITFEGCMLANFC